MPTKTSPTKAKTTKATPRSTRNSSGPAGTAPASKPVKKQAKSSAGKKPAAKKPSAKPVAKPAERASAKPKKAGPSKPVLKKQSGLDLAAKVLAESDRPLNAREIAERVIAAGWTTTGKTPHATLYSAMLREIKAKGEKSRFAKSERGRFEMKSSVPN